MPLRTDYTNDILDTSKNTERKYNIKNSNGTIVEENVTFEDVTDYTQEGSKFGASDINAITTRVNQLTASDGLDFRFATDGEGNYGYLKADDSFAPFSNLKNLKASIIETSYTVGDGTITKTYTATKDGFYIASGIATCSNANSSYKATVSISSNGTLVAQLIDVDTRTVINRVYLYQLNAGQKIDIVLYAYGYGERGHGISEVNMN